MTKKYAIGIDLGGTNLRVALVSQDGEIIKKIKEPTTGRLPENFFEIIEGFISDNIEGIGLGIAGLINRKDNTLYPSMTLQDDINIDLIQTLRSRYKFPLYTENSANTAALAEKICGAGKSFDSFVLLALGTRIGGGIIYRGRLLEVAAEFGHMSINSDAEKCACGNVGCLENSASANAMTARAISMIEKGSESILKDCCKGNIYKITPEDIYRCALEGDALSRDVLKEAGKALGVGLTNIINIISPEAIILTGGLIGAWNIYIQEAIKEASRRALKELFDSVKIIPSSLGDNAGVIGAASLVFRPSFIS